MRNRSVLPLAVAMVLVSFAPRARATDVTEFPDNGSEQMGRGGAWVARASDPLATMFNPAGLAGQGTRVTIQNNLILQHTCFSRLKATNDTTQDLVAPGAHYPRVCNDIVPNINPQLAATFRLTDRLGLGLAFAGPSAAGVKDFPEFVPDGTGGLQAAPSRYLLVSQSGVIAFPTVGVGYEVLDDLRLGASVSWGFAKIKLASATVALNTDGGTTSNDVRANLQVADYFVPGFRLGAIWSATDEIDVAGWYKWSDAIRATGDVGTAANYFGKQNAQGDPSRVRYGDTIFEDCGTGLPTKACGSGDNAKVVFYIPMEAKLGLRYHKPRGVLPKWAENVGGKRVRDPLATDKWDVELDLTWANNSAADTIQIRFPGDATGKGSLPVAGIAGSEIPPNGDQPRGYKDTVGARLGGDYNILPDQLAVRAGAFFETSAADPQYQSIDFAASAKFGLALGGTYRIRLGDDESSSAIELMLGYGHVFFAEQSREDANAQGLGALAGTSCNATTPTSPTTCSDGSLRYRTKWPVNLGTITNAINVVNAGVAYKF